MVAEGFGVRKKIVACIRCIALFSLLRRGWQPLSYRALSLVFGLNRLRDRAAGDVSGLVEYRQYRRFDRSVERLHADNAFVSVVTTLVFLMYQKLTLKPLPVLILGTPVFV